MATEKQIEANRKNAMESTGPKTETGKAIVSKNAIKHGIFSKDLLIIDRAGREIAEDIDEIYQNLIESLTPDGQMQHILVEKIAVDTCRLKRVLRYETGCIRQFIDAAILDYKKDTLSNEESEMKIKPLKEKIEYNRRYIELIRSGTVLFTQPYWQSGDIKINLEKELNDFCAEQELNQSKEFVMMRMAGHIDFSGFYSIIKQNHYSDDDIRKFLVQKAEKENIEYQKEMRNLEQKQCGYADAVEVLARVCCLPQDENIDKVLRYEKMLQKSIIQLLTLLKRLQKGV